MKIVSPPRYSQAWWAVMGATTGVVGVAAAIFLWKQVDLQVGWLLLFWAAAVLVSDLITALGMEATAPSRVTIGPGDRRFDADEPVEVATVVSGFEGADSGMVAVRGETWTARQSAKDTTPLKPGSEVRVEAREGLTLTVSGARR